MLTEEALTATIQDADKAASVCTRLCRYGGTIEKGTYHLHHNGLGNSDSDEQTVWSSATLALNQEALTTRLRDWLSALHQLKHYDVNTGKEA